MGRPRKEIKEKEIEVEPKLSHETKKGVIAVLFFGLAVILFLASFQKAGPAGDFTFNYLTALLGWGYYLVPAVLLLMANFLILGNERKFLSVTITGAIIFVISGLGIIDIVFPEKGGLAGSLVGQLQMPFGYTSALIITSSFFAASILITLNIPLRFKWKKSPENETPEEKPLKTELKELEEKDLVIKSPAAFSGENKTDIAKKKDDKPVKLNAENSTDKEKANDLAVEPAKSYANYIAPPADLLKSSIEKPTAGDLKANANIIKRTLDSFGIPVEMGEINIGPKVTQYTLKPAEGVKLSKIIALNPDLALALAAHPIRIEAPIPGKSLVGIEVPNKSAALVRLGSLISSPDFYKAGPVSFILGRDINGNPVLADIEKMPHLLVAGATGSGKSVTIHDLIVSLIYKNSPETLKLILIDPKRVELSVYDGIPHLITPVITEGKKAVGAFRWAINEMDHRYDILLKAKCRDIKSYNSSNNPPLPYLLLVVDELADLMASFGREIENSIVRLAQMARATGIHLVLATQRPSVEVITGLIKANIPSRIALQVASQIDSRTILDTSGAEKLLGGGDMLFLSAEFSKSRRIQGAYISEAEIKAVASFVADNNEALETNLIPASNTNVPNAFPTDMFSGVEGGNDEDELFEEAVTAIREAKKASASFLQRRLKVGYARAARLLDIMENKGIIGPGDGAKPREVYGSEDFENPALNSKPEPENEAEIS